MRWALTTVFFLSVSLPLLAEEPLPSRDVVLPMFLVPATEPMDFDLIDFRAEERTPASHRVDAEPNSIFVIKRHVGAAFGYDNGIVHTGIGLYLTVAELGRWNFGIPAVEFGIGRYPVYDEATKISTNKDQPTILISLASVHYRIGYVQSLGYMCYVNFEQIYDMRTNFAGSQFGFSFARK
jgi:hypothetical protein